MTNRGFQLHYSLSGENGKTLRFQEIIEFESSFEGLSSPCALAVERAAQLLFEIAGVSYFKLAAPNRVKYSGPVCGRRREFLSRVFKLGLSEFAHVNNLDLSQLEILGDEDVSDSRGQTEVPLALGLSKKVLLPFGGGKDSLLSLQLLTRAGFDVSLIVVGPNPVAEQLAEKTGKRVIRVKRLLDPQVKTLNAQGALNGHVPVTAIVSLIAILVALKDGFSAVVMSNEGSANVGSFVGEGLLEVNHQYSKSLAFETSLRQELQHLGLGELDYFSLLRPMSELMICRKFADLGKHLDGFVSCNKNFRRDASGKAASWCLTCPKCIFVYLCMAPFLAVETLDTIFGGNPLDRVESLEVLGALLGVEGRKRPFDCVGGPDECHLALASLAKRNDTSSWLCVRHYRSHWSQSDSNQEESMLFRLDSNHHIPHRFLGALDEVR